MKRYHFLATLALFAIVAMGCTREKPAEPVTPPQNVTSLSTPVSNPPSTAPTIAAVVPTLRPVPTGAITTTAPSGAITSTASIAIATDTPAPPAPSTSVSPTLSLPPGIFSPIQPITGTGNAPSISSATTSTPSASASSTGPTTYTVQWGDWLSKIARQFGVTNEAIIAANPRMNPNLLLPGQVLNIPGPGGNPPPSGATPTTSPPPGGATTYTVQRGDWFYAIARKFGVTVEALQAANPGVNPNFVFPGQVLNIPGASPEPSPTVTRTPGGATPTPGATGTPGGRPSRYTVQPGDTLYAIAIRFNTTIYALQIANHLASPHFIYPGQVLVIPK